MILSFKDKNTEKLFDREGQRKIPEAIVRQARRKLEVLNAATDLDSLRIPPGNQLEKLKGDRAGQYSIRINSQYRICFRWENSNCYDVEIVDYH